MSNTDLVMDFIRSNPGCTGSEIRVGTGVRPHQQVNQITRRLATSALILRQVSGKPAPAGFDGHGGCFIETGAAGRAAYGSGNFYSDPAPTVALHFPARRWHWGKVTFEQRVMRRWLCATTSP